MTIIDQHTQVNISPWAMFVVALVGIALFGWYLILYFAPFMKKPQSEPMPLSKWSKQHIYTSLDGDANARYIKATDIREGVEPWEFSVTGDSRILINNIEHKSTDYVLQDAVIRMAKIMASSSLTGKDLQENNIDDQRVVHHDAIASLRALKWEVEKLKKQKHRKP